MRCKGKVQSGAEAKKGEEKLRKKYDVSGKGTVTRGQVKKSNGKVATRLVRQGKRLA